MCVHVCCAYVCCAGAGAGVLCVSACTNRWYKHTRSFGEQAAQQVGGQQGGGWQRAGGAFRCWRSTLNRTRDGKRGCSRRTERKGIFLSPCCIRCCTQYLPLQHTQSFSSPHFPTSLFVTKTRALNARKKVNHSLAAKKKKRKDVNLGKF